MRRVNCGRAIPSICGVCYNRIHFVQPDRTAVMSETMRLTALAGSLFAMSYGGVAWVMAGTPVPAMPVPFGMPAQIASVPSMVPVATVPTAPPIAVAPAVPPAAAPSTTATIAAPKPSVIPPQPAPVQQAALPRSDGNAQRDTLRIEALKASTAYALTPCDAAAKTAMVAAVSSYAQAWADMMGCGPDGCDYKKINVTAATFSTPLDLQVRDAIGAAFDKRGIAIDDFPSSLRINVAMLVRGRGAPATACPQGGAEIIGR